MEIKAKKSLGQNFLINNDIINEIANNIEFDCNDLIIEIGPGKGALTKELKKHNSYLLCYEIDYRMESILKGLEDSKTKIIFSDFLKSNISDEIKDYNYDNLYIIANLPYYITTPIIEKIIDSKINPKSMLLMVQKEVAERFCAKPRSREYGYMTVYLNYYFDIEKIIEVNRKNFNPIPNVDSVVVKFIAKENNYNLLNREHFFQLIKDSFVLKRKTLKNNLFNYNWEIVKKVLLENNLNDNVRAEEISLDIFMKISNAIVNNPR